MSTEHATWLLFTWVFANQAGVPIPVVPWLIGAGVVAGAGHMSLVTTVVVTVLASLTADVTWYSIGRLCGAHTVTLLGKFSRHAAARVKEAERHFAAHQLGFLFASRFVPEINPLAAGMAGATRIPPGRYFAIVTVSALVWAVTWTGAGYALGNVGAGLSTPFGIATTVIVLAAAIAAIGFALMRRPTSQPRECLGVDAGMGPADELVRAVRPAHARPRRVLRLPHRRPVR